MTINLTPIFEAVLGLLAAIITYKLIPWIKSKTTVEQQKTLFAAYKVAIFAAEQLYGAGHGSEKLDYAVKYLEEKGIKVDRALLESLVYNYFNSGMIFLTEEEEAE